MEPNIAKLHQENVRDLRVSLEQPYSYQSDVPVRHDRETTNHGHTYICVLAPSDGVKILQSIPISCSPNLSNVISKRLLMHGYCSQTVTCSCWIGTRDVQSDPSPPRPSAQLTLARLGEHIGLRSAHSLFRRVQRDSGPACTMRRWKEAQSSCEEISL